MHCRLPTVSLRNLTLLRLHVLYMDTRSVITMLRSLAHTQSRSGLSWACSSVCAALWRSIACDAPRLCHHMQRVPGTLQSLVSDNSLYDFTDTNEASRIL